MPDWWRHSKIPSLTLSDCFMCYLPTTYPDCSCQTQSPDWLHQTHLLFLFLFSWPYTWRAGQMLWVMACARNTWEGPKCRGWSKAGAVQYLFDEWETFRHCGSRGSKPRISVQLGKQFHKQRGKKRSTWEQMGTHCLQYTRSGKLIRAR